MKLRFHYKNVLDNQVGIHGLKEKDIASRSSQLKKIQQFLQKQRNEKIIGFWDLPYKKDEVRLIDQMAGEIREQYEYFVLLGIGGSSLGPNSLHQALKSPYYNFLPRLKRQGPKMFFVDNVDPGLMIQLKEIIELDKTLFVVITKSGGTPETLAQYSIARRWVEQELGKDKVSSHFLGVTDPEKGILRDIIQKENWKSLAVPPNVGGRFSVFSPVGLLSAACAGINIGSMLEGAREMDKESAKLDNVFENIPYLNALINYLMYLKGKTISVMMPYSNALYGFADWYRQLWAESLGKKLNIRSEAVYVGQTPVKALGATDQHSQIQLYIEGPFDKLITFIRVNSFPNDEEIPSVHPEYKDIGYLENATLSRLLNAECQATQIALTQKQRPNCCYELESPDPYLLGQLYYSFQVQTVVAGALFEINPFDQPGVEDGKIATKLLMERMKEQY